MRFLGRRVPLSGADPSPLQWRSRQRSAAAAGRRAHQAPPQRQLRQAVRQGLHRAGQRAAGRRHPQLTCATFACIDPREGDPQGQLAWRPLRRGIADLHRRAEVGRKATERYLDALASIDEDTTLDDVLHRLGQPQYWHGRRVRALHPFAPDDRQLLQAVSRGEFTINGFRNRDLQRLYFAQPPATPAEARRRSAWVSRKLRLLRAHGLIYKVDWHPPLPPHQSRTHRHHRHPHRAPLQRPSTHCRRGINHAPPRRFTASVLQSTYSRRSLHASDYLTDPERELDPGPVAHRTISTRRLDSLPPRVLMRDGGVAPMSGWCRVGGSRPRAYWPG